MTVFGELKLPPERKLINIATRVYQLLDKLSEIEADAQVPANEKISLVKQIKEELDKVAQEVDIIKQEFNLLTHYRIN
jgi:hypothetical protein